MNKKYILLISAILSFFFFSACGNPGSEESSGSGSISFKIIWQGAPTLSDSKPEGSDYTGVREAAIDCTVSGVSTVEASIYNSSGTLLASGAWSCSAHSGTITGISAGTSRSAVIQGKDSSGNVIYKGEDTGITITSGQTTTSTVTLSPTPVTLTSELNLPIRVAVDSTNIYWTENNSSGTVKKVSISGGTVTTLASGLNNPAGIAIDSTNVYWTEENSSGTVKKVSISGGTITTLASGLNDPADIAVDSTNVYWTENNSSGTVKKVSISGGTVTTLASAQSYPYGIAIDSTSVYWAEFSSGTSGTVKKVSISGGTVTTLASGLSSPDNIAVDSTNVYWTEFTTSGTVKKVSISGGTVTTLASGLNKPWDIAIDSTNVYWTENNSSGTVKKVSISGGTVTTLASGLSSPAGIAVDSTNIYWTIYSSSSGTINRIVKGETIAVSDTTAPLTPSISINSGSSSTTSSTVTLSVSATDSTGVTGYYITDNSTGTTPSTPSASATGWTSVTSATSYSNTSLSYAFTGSYSTGTTVYVYIWFKDAAGNVSAVASDSITYSTTTNNTNLMGGSIQGTSLNLTSTNAVVTTFAGSAGSSGSTNATGTSARFYYPYGITTDGTNLFVADYSNHTIRKIVISTGVVTTIAGSAGSSGSTDATGTSARFNYPTGITTDGTNLFVADTSNHTIRKIVISTGVVTTIAGSAGSSGSTNATGTSARFNYPYGITTDGTNLFVADQGNHTIRKIVISTGVVTTIAGSAGSTGSTDATGTSARFYYPQGITTDGTNLYVADTYNYTIRKIVISTGVVTTIAGSAGSSGSTDATGTSARFYLPAGITTDGTNLFVVDYGNYTIRKIVISTGVVTTIAGTAGSSGSTDATGTSARFYNPIGITTDGTNLYVADTYNYTIRKIAPSTSTGTLMGGSVQGTSLNLTSTNAVVTTFAGSTTSGSTNATGTSARFYYPEGMTTDGTNLFVADNFNHTIRKIVISTGVVTTIAGSTTSGSTDGTGTSARFNYPTGITTDGTNLFVVDQYNHTIRKIVISTGVVTTLAGSTTSGSTDGTGTSARFYYPTGITTDGTNLFVADTSNHTIRKIVISTGVVTTIAGSAGSSGSTNATGTSARFYYPTGITTDGTNLFVADTSNHTIRKIVISTGVVTTIAGTAGSSGSTDGTGTSARFYVSYGITTDGTNLFVADSWNHTIRKIVISTGVVTTIAGSAGLTGSTDATGTSARFYYPEGMTTDGTNLFVADSANHTIRKIQ